MKLRLMAMGLALSCAAVQADTGGELRWHANASATNQSAFRQLAEARPQGALEASASSSWGSWHGSAIVAVPTTASGESKATLAALYWESGAWTVGRKAVSWDVGYAFRPLDVLLYEPRRWIMPALVTQGTDMIAWQALGKDDALDLVWANPGAGRRSKAREDEAIAVRYFFRAGDADMTTVLRSSSRYGWELGTGAAAVVGEAWEFHGSALFRSRGETTLVPGSNPSDPLVLHRLDPSIRTATGGRWRSIAGLQRSWAGGVQLLVEAWWDGAARSRSEWQSIARRAGAVAVMSGAPATAINGEIGWMATALRDESLGRENLLLRLGQEEGTWRPALEMLVATADRGYAATASLTYVGDRVRIDGGMRQFGGPAEASYRLQPNQNQVWVSCRFAW